MQWTVDSTLSLSTHLLWCGLLIDWLIVMDRLVLGLSQYCQVVVFLGERKRRGMCERGGRYWSGAVCIKFQVYLTFQTAGIITTVHLWCPLPLSLSSSLPHFTFPLVSPMWIGVCVRVCEHVFQFVCVCMLELQIKLKLSCFDCSLRVPAAQGPSAVQRTHTLALPHIGPVSVTRRCFSLAFLLSGVGNSSGNSFNY